MVFWYLSISILCINPLPMSWAGRPGWLPGTVEVSERSQILFIYSWIINWTTLSRPLPGTALVPPTERPKGNGAKTQRAGDLEGRLRCNPWATLRRVRTCFAAVSEGDCPLRMRAHTCNCHSCRSLPLQRYPINYGRGFRTARASLWLSLSISYEAERQLKKDKFQFFYPT